MIFVGHHYTTDWDRLADVTMNNTKQYCIRHGYGIADDVSPPYPKYTGLHKLRLYDLLNDGDVIMIADCDAIITNHNERVENFIDDEHDLFLSEGCNMGIFIIRKSEWADSLINWMKRVIDTGRFHCEQDAIEFYMRELHDEKIKICKHPCFNSYLSELYPEVPQPVSEQQGQWVEGKSFILHLPALPMHKRLEIMKTVKITQ